MPSKKKKYNARFPPARIKKIMQTDEEVGKVAAAVPVIISRALELFIDSLIEKTATVTREKHAKTLSTSHIKQAIHSEKTFDFLRDLVKNVPDHQADEEEGGLIASGSGAQEPKPKQLKPRKPREPSDQEPGKTHCKRGPGRPRKVQQVQTEEKKESSSAETDSEETETDEEQNTSEAEQGIQEQSMPPDTGGVTATPSLSIGQTSNAQSTLQAPLSSSNITFPGTNSPHIQPPFPPAQVQAYPMHNIPIPQYPYPMQIPLCGPPQFASAPTLNSSNSPNPQFMPQMIPPFIPQPFFNMPPAGFMMSPAPSQTCAPFQNVSNNICRPVLETAPVHSVAMPQQDVDLNKQSSQKDDRKSNNSEMPLDMSVSGKTRSQSITEPQTSMAQGPSTSCPSAISRMNQPTPQLVSKNYQQGHSVGSSEQSVNKNGPVFHSQLRQDNSNQQNSLKESKVKPEKYSEQGFSSAVERKSVPKKENRSSDLNSIQYENLSNLMNRGPTKIVNNKDDDDYDT